VDEDEPRQTGDFVEVLVNGEAFDDVLEPDLT
jgi:hypothetical protein